MKYFAKYLPVEGEIKEGDITFDGLLTYPISPERWKLLQRDKTGHLLTKLKKVKLFLCSTDIQVGDKVWRRTEEFTTATEAYCRHPQSQDFKVIGEISPDATWAKEGDEFDEYRNLTVGMLPNKQKKYISIKGPCGHFH